MCLVERAELAPVNTSSFLSFLSSSFFFVLSFSLLLFLSFLFACFALSFWRCFPFLSFEAFSGWSCQQSLIKWLVQLQWLQGWLPFLVSKAVVLIELAHQRFLLRSCEMIWFRLGLVPQMFWSMELTKLSYELPKLCRRIDDRIQFCTGDPISRRRCLHCLRLLTKSLTDLELTKVVVTSSLCSR